MKHTILAACAALTFSALPLSAQTIAPEFAADYSLSILAGPAGVPPSLGGLTFLAGDPNTLLIGGSANGGAGAVYFISVVRDAQNHITGFSGTAQLFATAPNIDGGLAYGPGGVLFYTAYPTNQIGQIKPGSSSPDKIVDLTSLGINASVGTLAFVPVGFSNAGAMVVASYNGGNGGIVALTPDANGTYDLDSVQNAQTFTGGPEGIAYVKAGNDEFSADSMLVSLYGTGQVVAYEIDGNGLPVLATARTFISGLSGAEGAVIDPVTGDYIFSTFGGGDRIAIVTGLEAPITPGVPEPSTWAMMLLGFGGLAFAASRKHRRPIAAAA